MNRNIDIPIIDIIKHHILIIDIINHPIILLIY